ncbi:MAG: hypothetical protein JWM53_6659 [bacterium]|nr:hypothetical protein [bacterium]
MDNRDGKARGPDEPHLEPLRPRRDSWSVRLIRWHAAPPKDGESVRWESIDGRWIAISLGTGDELGHAVVASVEGRRAVVDTYEAALVMAETWRT